VRKITWLILVAIVGVAGWFAWALLMPVQPGGQTIVMLRPGFSTRHIASELKRAGIIRSEDAFVLWHYFHHKRSLKAGEYLFEEPANILDIQKRLRRGDVYFHTLVVPEGYTMFDIANAIEAAGLGPAQDFLKVAQFDTDLIADIAPNARSLEGYLFPDTYEFSRMMSMQEMAAAMVCQFRVVARQIGLITGQGEAVESGPGRSGHLCGVVMIQFHVANDTPSITPEISEVQRTVIMASIVEKETAVAEERPMVASVYYNRLSKNIALDADPSIIYAELLAGTYQGALHHADMQFHSPYNTYRNPGLPPGPIGNPGRSALEAALHPAQSDYYYFVADAQGHHRFARTIEEHNKNVVAYRQAMRGR
jgi:peptidoglycan lytic transglycosylase G